jgi:hypothetical protein
MLMVGFFLSEFLSIPFWGLFWIVLTPPGAALLDLLSLCSLTGLQLDSFCAARSVAARLSPDCDGI